MARDSANIADWTTPQRVVSRVAQGVIAAECGWILFAMLGYDHRYDVGIDYRQYREAAASWLDHGTFYMPFQLAGPYAIYQPDGAPVSVMYPPVTLWLLVPFVFLPALLWWAVPLATVGWSFARLHPAWWSWPIIAALLLWPPAAEAVLWGNPVIWAWAAIALGVVYPGPAALALFKPTLLPFAVLGIRHRGWWLLLAAGLIAALPFGAMWLDYWRAIVNGQGNWEYIFHDFPLVATPLIARLGSLGWSVPPPAASGIHGFDRNSGP